jgi:hypothetical protein
VCGRGGSRKVRWQSGSRSHKMVRRGDTQPYDSKIGQVGLMLADAISGACAHPRGAGVCRHFCVIAHRAPFCCLVQIWATAAGRYVGERACAMRRSKTSYVVLYASPDALLC